MDLEEIKANALEGAQFYNDEFEEDGSIIYLRKHQGILQYYDYKCEWSNMLFSIPFKSI